MKLAHHAAARALPAVEPGRVRVYGSESAMAKFDEVGLRRLHAALQSSDPSERAEAVGALEAAGFSVEYGPPLTPPGRPS